jgi:GNAT superfamily N-acetyltransferase
MDFQIREAILGDFEEISKLFIEICAYHSQALPQIFKPVTDARSRKIKAELITDENVAMFVAVYEGKVIGLVRVHIRESPDIPVLVKRRYVYVSDIIVTEKYRGSSIGRELMDTVEQWALGKGIKQVELNVWDFNESALAFYDKLGYSVSRKIMCKTIQ